MVRWHSSTKSKPDHSERVCFVISPIGADNSEMRKHANAVHELIIEPAFKIAAQDLRCEFKAERADHKLHHGNIVSDVIDHILRDDIIIAVLSFARHNVYYELGIAHAAGRQPILLIDNREKDDLPFDIKQDSFIGYDYDPVALKSGKAAGDLAKKIVDMIGKGKSVVKPFGRELKEFKPFGSEHANFRFFSAFRDLQIFEWLSVVEGATRFLTICEPELAMSGSLPDDHAYHMIELITAKAKAGVRVSVLYSPPVEPLLPSEPVRDAAAVAVTEYKKQRAGYDKQKAEYDKKVLFVGRLRGRLQSEGVFETVNWVQMTGEKDADCYLLTNEDCLIVRGTLGEKPFGLRTALWASSQIDAEFYALYRDTLEDLRQLSIRNGGGEIEVFGARNGGVIREPRLAPYSEAMEVIESAREFLVVVEPSYSLVAPFDFDDDDREIRSWRQKIRLAVSARAIQPGFRLALLSYDPKNPIFVDEVIRGHDHMPRAKALETAKACIEGWWKLRESDLSKLPAQETGTRGNWRIATLPGAVISERVIFTESMLLAVPLLGKLGRDVCSPIKRMRGSAEYDGFYRHLVNIAMHDVDAADIVSNIGSARS